MDYATARPPQIFEWVQAHGGDPLIPFSGALEAKLLEMPEDEREVYCKEVRQHLGARSFDGQETAADWPA